VSQELIPNLKKLISSNDSTDKVVGLSTLISLAGVANESSLNTIAVHFLQLVSLRNIISREENIIVLASVALGKLLSAPTTTTFELADEEFKYALNTLKNDQNLSRFAACCEIKEIAQRIPILFAVYLGEFLSAMWNAIRDSKDYIREAGIETFTLALQQMETREELFNKVYSECQKGLLPESPPSSIIGSLSVLKVLLENNSKLLIPHLPKICEIVKKTKDHKVLGVKQAVLEMTPALIGFITSDEKGKGVRGDICEIFVENAVRLAINAGKDTKSEVFLSLGQIAMLKAPGFEQRAKAVIDLVLSELKKKPLQVTVFEVLKGAAHALEGRICEYIEMQSHINTVKII
jgi:hypothetical protein